MTALGFLGLGSMGSAIAGALVGAGNDVRVWNRSAGAADALVASGAHRARNAADALSADISFSMLANDEAVEAVLTDAAIAGMTGRTHVMLASISPALADRLSAAFDAAGAAYVAAPVLGRPELAADGQLNVLVAGSPVSVAAVAPYLAIIGKRTWHLGERPSVANAVKAAVNYNIIHAMQAIGETVAMTERQGVDPQLFTELLSSTLFGGTVYSVYGGLIARGGYTPPGFRMALGRKDLGLAQEVASAVGVKLATMEALRMVFDRALEESTLKEADWSAIAEVSRRDLL